MDRSARLVAKIRCEPSFDLGHSHALTPSVVFDLVARDAIDGEVARVRMREVEAADRSGWEHGEVLRERDAGALLGGEQVEEDSLLGVVGARGVAGRRPDAAVLFVDELLVTQILVSAVTPVRAGALVQQLGERFGQPIGQGPDHDGVIVVMIGLEAAHEFSGAIAGGNREGTEVIESPAVGRRDEVGQRVETLLPDALPLLT